MSVKSKKLRNSARGQECQIRIPDICNFNPETTVLCHINGGGMGMKSNDTAAAFGCSACHDAVDHRSRTQYTNDELKLMHLDGVMRTQAIWLNEGLLVVK